MISASMKSPSDPHHPLYHPVYHPAAESRPLPLGLTPPRLDRGPLRTYVRIMSEQTLPDGRLETIAESARQSNRFGDKVTIELVREIRELRAQLAEMYGPFDDGS